MPTLTLKFKEKTIKEYKLKKGNSITIGRKENNDIVLENLAVSGNHAKIDSVGDGFLLTDLQSKNGSFVNEQLIKSHYMQHEDIVLIGKHTLVFTYNKDEITAKKASMKDMDKTMVMDTNEHRAMLAKTASEDRSRAKKAKRIGILSYLAGGEGEIELHKKLTKIGKDSNSDIHVSGFMVGKTAATISSRPNGYYFSYVSGVSKPKINSKTIKESIKLEEFDTIEIGSLKLQFIYRV